MHDFMKTIISAIQSWVTGKIKDSTADWNQSDSSADSYIKNKPFDEKIVKNIIVDSLTSDDYQNDVNVPACNFVPNQKYDVIWNGVLYKDLVCFFDGDYNIIGNPEELPFYIDDDGGNDLYIESNDEEDAPYTVSIIEYNAIIKKIDKKFLPSAFGQPDWNQNDPDGDGYIKNRTHYKEEISEYVCFDGYMELGTKKTVQLDIIIPENTIIKVYAPGDQVFTSTTHKSASNDGSLTASNGMYNIDFYNDDNKLIIGNYFANGNTKIIAENVILDLKTLDDVFIPNTITRNDELVAIKSTGVNSVILNGLQNNVASGNYSHAEGSRTTASGYHSHSEGLNTTASGYNSHAEGNATIASGENSHAEGMNSKATTDITAKAINDTRTSLAGYSAHAEGYGTIACGAFSHAEGNGTKASGKNSHAEGFSTTTSGDSSHAEGDSTTASGENSHAEG